MKYPRSTAVKYPASVIRCKRKNCPWHRKAKRTRKLRSHESHNTEGGD